MEAVIERWLILVTPHQTQYPELGIWNQPQPTLMRLNARLNRQLRRRLGHFVIRRTDGRPFHPPN